jgi:hypothetical protein
MSDFNVAIQNSLRSFEEEQDFQMYLEMSKYSSKPEFAQNPQEREVRGDGNCLFRCIAIEMYDDENYHTLVRQKMIDFLKQNKKRYQGSANLAESIDMWIGRMTNSGCEEFGLMGEFGDAFAVELLSWMLERPIVVSLRDIINDNLLYTDTIGEWFDKSSIRLILRGQHYNLLV